MKYSLSQKGFTLIELMVVVVIIAIFSGVLIPKLLSVYDKSRQRGKEEQLTESAIQVQRPQEPFTPPPGVPPVVESAKMNISLRSTYHRVGMRVYTRYEAHCQGSFLFSRSSHDKNPVLLTIPFPEGRAEARDVQLTFTRTSDSTNWEPESFVFHGQSFYLSGDIPDGEQVLAKVNFVALGREQFAYHLPAARQLSSIEFTLDLKEGYRPRIPDHALQPTAMGEQHWVWTFNNLITDRAIILEIPGALSPLGRVLLLVRLVAIAVLLFGIGFWYLSEQWEPGLLKDFRWGHFFLLALTYSLYFIIFAVISFQEDVNTWLAMIISALFSFPLLLLHVTRVIHWQFAIRRAFPLAVFTLLLVINGVYGGGIRDYVFIAAVIFVIAYLTMSYDKWSIARRDYREQKRARHEKRIKILRNKLNYDVKQLIDDMNVVHQEAEQLLQSSQQRQLDTERFAMTQKQQPVTEQLKAYKDLVKRLPELMNLPDYGWDEEWYKSYEKEIEQFERETRKIITPLRRAVESLKHKKDEFKSQQGEEAAYCVACGSASPSSSYCPECGMKRYKELICQRCGEQLLVPLHSLSDTIDTLTLYCPSCGQQCEPIVLKMPKIPKAAAQKGKKSQETEPMDEELS